MSAAKIVSRASAAAASPPDAVSETMSATSMAVTARANVSVPYGSPTRWAMTSAWCTAERTALPSANPTSAANQPPAPAPTAAPASTSQPKIGAVQVQRGT